MTAVSTALTARIGVTAGCWRERRNTVNYSRCCRWTQVAGRIPHMHVVARLIAIGISGYTSEEIRYRRLNLARQVTNGSGISRVPDHRHIRREHGPDRRIRQEGWR